MTKNIYETRNFLRERKKWYDKLKEEGFDDIEYTDWKDGSSKNLLGGEGVKSWADMSGVRNFKDGVHDSASGTIQRVEAQQRYFELARQFYWDVCEGEDEETAEMWRLHADGASVWEIHRMMGVNRARITARINELADRMLQEAYDGGYI